MKMNLELLDFRLKVGCNGAGIPAISHVTHRTNWLCQHDGDKHGNTSKWYH